MTSYRGLGAIFRNGDAVTVVPFAPQETFFFRLLKSGSLLAAGDDAVELSRAAFDFLRPHIENGKSGPTIMGLKIFRIE